jgi:hypothetical protein
MVPQPAAQVLARPLGPDLETGADKGMGTLLGSGTVKETGTHLGSGTAKEMGSDLGAGAVEERAGGDRNVAAGTATFEPFSGLSRGAHPASVASLAVLESARQPRAVMRAFIHSAVRTAPPKL